MLENVRGAASSPSPSARGWTSPPSPRSGAERGEQNGHVGERVAVGARVGTDLSPAVEHAAEQIVVPSVAEVVPCTPEPA